MFPSKEPAIDETGDLIDELLASFGGDARAALRSVVGDCHHLYQELLLCQAAMSKGFTRGWAPKLEREAASE